MSDVQLVGIVGSLRAGSVNGTAARAGAAIAPDGVIITLHDVHHGLPDRLRDAELTCR
ncbi:MAG: hypothetical protein WA964_09810 [Ilumatobacter sp.]|uniref:hypothetical protein n=1 Tax=Ilumatobacter sp. TaxID=1967498 RepID=UPI003C74637E